MTMRDKLSAEDFKLFSAAYVNEFNRSRAMLATYRDMAKEAERKAQYHAARLREQRINAMHHGVELPE